MKRLAIMFIRQLKIVFTQQLHHHHHHHHHQQQQEELTIAKSIMQMRIQNKQNHNQRQMLPLVAAMMFGSFPTVFHCHPMKIV
jgi:hypothetical protein